MEDQNYDPNGGLITGANTSNLAGNTTAMQDPVARVQSLHSEVNSELSRITQGVSGPLMQIAIQLIEQGFGWVIKHLNHTAANNQTTGE